MKIGALPTLNGYSQSVGKFLRLMSLSGLGRSKRKLPKKSSYQPFMDETKQANNLGLLGMAKEKTSYILKVSIRGGPSLIIHVR